MSETAPASANALPRPGSLGAWVLATRPKTLVAGWAPVLVGSSIAFAAGSFRPVRALGALVVAVSIQIGTNLVNDAADHARGADRADRLGPPRAVASGLLPSRAVWSAALDCFVLAGGVGVWLASVSSWWLLLPGGIAILAGVAYTAGPKPLAYLGLGELFVFLFFGLFATVGTALVVGWTLGPEPHAVFYSVPFGVSLGFLAVAILEINNIRDLPTDKMAGKATWAVRVGDRTARRTYRLCIVGGIGLASFVSLLFAAGAPAMLAPLLAIGFAIDPLKAVAKGVEGRALVPVLGATARVESVLASLIAVGFVAGGSGWVVFST